MPDRDSEQREPLWASSLAPERAQDRDAQPEPESSPAAEPQPAPEVHDRAPVAEPRLPAFVVGGALASLVLLVALAIAVGRGSDVTLDTVDSFWGDIPMECNTLRLGDEFAGIEFFECDGEDLPSGVYATPESQWESDLTREEAAFNYIVIAADGDLQGVALYG